MEVKQSQIGKFFTRQKSTYLIEVLSYILELLDIYTIESYAELKDISIRAVKLQVKNEENNKLDRLHKLNLVEILGTKYIYLRKHLKV